MITNETGLREVEELQSNIEFTVEAAKFIYVGNFVLLILIALLLMAVILRLYDIKHLLRDLGEVLVENSRPTDSNKESNIETTGGE